MCEDEPVALNELSFSVFDVDTGDVTRFDPSGESTVAYDALGRGDAETAVRALYREHDYRVRDINHKYKNSLRIALGIDEFEPSYHWEQEELIELREQLCKLVLEHTSSSNKEDALDLIDILGTPDLLIHERNNQRNFSFIEVKKANERLNNNQKEWIQRFSFLPVKIAKVFQTPEARNEFVEGNSVDDILSASRPASPEEYRPKLSESEIAAILATVEVGDRILFNDRKAPHEVIDTDATNSGAGPDVTGIEVKSPQATHCVLSRDGDWFRCGFYRRDLWWVKVLDRD